MMYTFIVSITIDMTTQMEGI